MEHVLTGGWRLSAAARLSIRCWEQECVLYDATTGDTHLMCRADAELLERFRADPLTVQTFSGLQASFGGTELETVLADFERREFVTAV